MEHIKLKKNADIMLWADHVPVEPLAMDQLYNVAALPIVKRHIAVMPDVHVGMGATIGSVIPTQKAIIPCAVGVDIGCGMCAVKTSLTSFDLLDNTSEVRSAIEAAIPVGFSTYSRSRNHKSTRDHWKVRFESEYDQLIDKHPGIKPRSHHPITQLGTLGGGNHFIELCLDEEDNVWVMLHSGSRGIGNRIGTYFISKAKEEMSRLGIRDYDRSLSYLTEDTEAFDDYVTAVDWAQDYARVNRVLMLANVLEILEDHFTGFNVVDKAVNTHHNYVQKEIHFNEEVWLTRKGAISAKFGELGIIPGSMGEKSFIVEGLGNSDSYHSCSHGAGRLMSRSAAKKKFTVEDHIRNTQGVDCRKDAGVLDETPGCYKNIDDVMASQEDLVRIKYTLKQIMNIKG